MADSQKDSREPQNTQTEGNTIEPATDEEGRAHNRIKSFIQHLKNLTDDLRAERRKADLQYRNAVKIRDEWAYEYVTWESQYDVKQMELAELVSLKSPMRRQG